jgi:phosphatidylglycerol:prolipoprotein diacylglycerol transferase
MISSLFNYIVWDPNIIAIKIGSFGIRWYSLCWCVGLIVSYIVVMKLYEHQKIKKELFEPLFLYVFIGILAGSRLGHCLFYQPDYFLSHPIEMFLPIRQINGAWKLVGYEGLASHGGTLGTMIALWLYVRKTKMNVWQVLDNIAIATPFTAFAIRMGNLMNSEIIGKVTDMPWAFIFERVDQYPRHPGQLYEAIAYLILFLLMLAIYKKHSDKVGTGWFFGLCLAYIFTFRFFIEYTKEIQEAFEANMLLDMGQILSIPFIVVGIVCMCNGAWKQKFADKLSKKTK